MRIEPTEDEKRLATDPIGGLRECALEVQSSARVLEALHQQADLLPLSVREVAAGLGRTLQRVSERVVICSGHLQDVQAARLLAAKPGELPGTSTPAPAGAPPSSEDEDEDAGEGDDQT